MVEITSKEQNKVKRMTRSEDSLRDIWDNIKHTNIQIIGVPEEEEEKKKEHEKIFEEIIVENFPNMEKEIGNQVQEVQRIPYRINPRRHILSSVQFSHSAVSDSLRPHESQHTRPHCPSPTPRVHSDSRSLSQ